LYDVYTHNGGVHETQTCILMLSLDKEKLAFNTDDLLKRFNSYEICYDRTRKRWPFNKGDFLIEATTLVGFKR
jgi:hypothetical protein